MSEEKPKTILLVFIHGFKGDDTTFSTFPTHISTLLSTRLSVLIENLQSSHALSADASPPAAQLAPTVTPILVPAFETRGSLANAVSRFRAWLLEKVIDAEVARGTPSPTVSPGVGVIIVGHSMGGIVAAEACLEIVAERALDLWKDAGYEQQEEKSKHEIAWDEVSATFPRVLGVLAFDTPYLGISPGVVRYGAEEKFTQGKEMYDGALGLLGATGLAGLMGGGGGDKNKKPPPSPSASSKDIGSPTKEEPAPKSKWGNWGKAALLAGGAAATIGAAGAATYAARGHITSGWNWVGSHLEFVGTLTREVELQKRFGAMVETSRGRGVPERELNTTESWRYDVVAAPTSQPTKTVKPAFNGPGFAVFFTSLGEKSRGDVGDREKKSDEERTFCRLPPNTYNGNLGVPTRPQRQREQELREADWARYWVRAQNTRAPNELDAHVGMFGTKENEHYEAMASNAATLLGEWIPEDWYYARDASRQDLIEAAS